MTGNRVELWLWTLQDRESERFGDIESSVPFNTVFSPDGQWVAYTQRGENGATYAQALSFPEARYQIGRNEEAVHHPLWAPDGSRLFYFPGASSAVAVDVATEPTFSFGRPVPLPGGGLPLNVNTTVPLNHDIAPDVGEAPAGLNRVDRRVGRGEHPQPPEPGRDLPPRFIGDDHRTPAHRGTQRGVGRVGLSRRLVQRPHQGAARHGQAEACAEQRGDAAERHAELDVQRGAQRDHRGPQLHGGGPQGIRGLQGMPPLHPTVALLAPPHMDRKGPDHRADRRQVNLRLGGDPRFGHGTATVRTGGRQGRVVPFVDPPRRGPTPPAAVGGPGLPPRATGRACRGPARKGSRLTKPSAPGRVQLPLQPIDCALQPRAIPLRAAQVRPQALVLALEILDHRRGGGLNVGRRVGVAARAHATVMPNP